MATTTQKRIPTYDRTASANGGGAATALADWRDPRYQAFALMRLAFTVAPIAFGLDKFFNVMVHWPNYLAPWINDIAPGTGQEFMYFVGVTGDFRKAHDSDATPRRKSRRRYGRVSTYLHGRLE